MERYQEDFELAKNKFKIVDHMVNVTYPMLRDTRLLMSSLENLFFVYSNAMSALLHYERLYKRIPPFNNTFESKFFMYSRTCQSKFNLEKDYAIIMQEIKKFVIEHKKSPVEFSKNDKFVICSNTYDTMVLTHSKLKDYLTKAKLFIEEINSIIYKNPKVK